MASPSPATSATPGVAPSPTPEAVGPARPAAPRLALGGPSLAPQLPPTPPALANYPQATTAPGRGALRFTGPPQFSFPSAQAAQAATARS